jgi:hypothetical protein
LQQKNRLQNEKRGKIWVVPLTFDFHLEYEEDTPTFKTAPKITEDKSCDIKKSKR